MSENMEKRAPEKEVKEPKKKKKEPKVNPLQKELDETKDKLMRVTAEYDNFRKRSQKEREGIYADAAADSLKELLPLIDNLERATQYTNPEKVAEGVEMVLSTLPAVFEKLKVSSKAAETLLKEYQTTCFFIPLVAPCTPLLIKVVVELFTVFIYDLNTALLWVFNFGLPNRSRLALIFLYRAAAEVRRTSAAVSAAGKGAIPFCAAPRFWGHLIAPIL